jgi:CubicO group peptidase (beta-lactamase class C family)
MRTAFSFPILALAAAAALAQLPAPTQTAIDQAARKVLASTGSTSASIAVVKDGKIAYVQAYGDARLDPKVPARPDMRYKIGSNTKQFVATAMLMLAEKGKLSLDDPVSRFIPGLTRGSEVTIRQLLSHTSGYQDYYPLDYVAPFMTHPTTMQAILDTWAKKPLDFDPGTQWQYSNTNYAIAGLIVERVSGKPLFEFLRTQILEPLGMHSAIDSDHETWSDTSPTGYLRYAVGPPRPAPPEGAGWLNAAGELAMTAGDLALWDISLMNGTLLKAASLRALTTEVDLKNGGHTRYALGLQVSNTNGRRRWSHGGGTSGFTSYNVTFPDDRISITVLTSSEAGASHLIEGEIEKLVTAPAEDPQADPVLDRVRQLFSGLQDGKPERSWLTDDANAYFTTEVIADFASSLKPFGTPTGFTQTSKSERGGMTYRSFSIRFGEKSLTLSTFFTPEGKIAQYLLYPAE